MKILCALFTLSLGSLSLLAPLNGQTPGVNDFNQIDKSTFETCSKALSELSGRRNNHNERGEFSAAQALNPVILQLRCYMFAQFEQAEDPLVGVWAWFDGHRKYFQKGGNVYAYRDRKGDRLKGSSWKLLDRKTLKYEVVWGGGKWVDTVTINPEIGRLDGRNQSGVRVSAIVYE